MKKVLILLVTLLSFSSYAKDAPKKDAKEAEYKECVSVYGPDVGDVEDLSPTEEYDKDDIFKIPKGWKFVSFSHNSGRATVILLCR